MNSGLMNRCRWCCGSPRIWSDRNLIDVWYGCWFREEDIGHHRRKDLCDVRNLLRGKILGAAMDYVEIRHGTRIADYSQVLDIRTSRTIKSSNSLLLLAFF